MRNKRVPLHPGEFIKRVYIEENELTQSALAEGLDIHKGTLSRLLNGQTEVTPSMAVKLSAVLGRSAESWLNMQAAHSLAKAEADLGGWTPKLILNNGELVPQRKARNGNVVIRSKRAAAKKTKPAVA